VVTTLTGRPRSRAHTHVPTQVWGRAASVLLPVLVVTSSTHGREHLFVSTLVLSAVWFAGLEAGFAASRTTLAALGRPVAVLRGVLLGFVLAAATAYVFPALGTSVPATMTTGAAIFVLATSWELVANRILPPKRILFIGSKETRDELVRELERRENSGLVVVGAVDDNPDDGDSLLLGPIADIPRIVDTSAPDLVVLAPGCNRPQIFAELLDSSAHGFKFLELAQLYEHAFGRVPVRDLTGPWFMSVLHLYQRPYSQLAKRTLDIVGALLLLVIAAPLFPVLALAVRGTGRRIILTQRRVGENGEIFTMCKFRTMRPDAERPGEAVWASKGDPRVTTTGRLMRRLRLDELPQVWNVLRGDMSLVGPRPERPEFIDELLEAVPFWERRHLVKPGITGWAQVNRGYTADYEGSLDKLSYDLWYVRHRSLTVDIVICARTLWTVVWGERRQDADSAGEELDPLVTLLHATAAIGTPAHEAEG